MVLNRALANGEDILSTQKSWLESAELKTFDDAVAAIAVNASEELKAYQAAVADATTSTSCPSLNERRLFAKKHLHESIFSQLFFDWDLPRTTEGSYRWAPNVKAVISRALLVAGLGEATWARMDYPVKPDIEAFHLAIREIHPDRKFAFGYTGGYDWLKAGWTPEEVKNFPWDCSQKYGMVWHVQPIWALQGQRRGTEDFSRLWQKGGIAAYMSQVQGPELGITYPDLAIRDCGLGAGEAKDEAGYARFKFSGAFLADALLETATMGINGAERGLKMGEGVVKGPKQNRFG